MAKGTFGEKLKRERELRGVSLEEVSSATRITLRYLLALENEQWEQLPGGVFNRGFVRTVARYLGLNEEEMLGDFAAATAPADVPAEGGRSGARLGTQVVTRPRGAAAVPLPKETDGRVTRLILMLVVVAALVVGAWFAWQKWGAEFLRRERGVASPATPAAEKPATQSAPVQTEAPKSQSTPGPAGGAGAAKSAETPEPELLRLKVETGRSTHVTVIADGHTVLDEVVEAGRSLRFEARDRFEISAKDSGAVLLELNGQTMPPLGMPGQGGRSVLSRRDLKRRL